jgi:hypothetical protein
VLGKEPRGRLVLADRRQRRAARPLFAGRLRRRCSRLRTRSHVTALGGSLCSSSPRAAGASRRGRRRP